MAETPEQDRVQVESSPSAPESEGANASEKVRATERGRRPGSGQDGRGLANGRAVAITSRMTLPRPAAELRVRDIMTVNVVTLEAQQSLPLADALMQMRRIRHLPVVDQARRLVGLVTHRDLLAAQLSNLAPLDAEQRSSLQLSVPVSKIMQRQVWTVEPDALALHAANLLRDHPFGCLPVTQAGALVGIVTEADFVKLLTDSLALGPPPDAPQVKHVMSKLPLTLGRTATLGEARSLMHAAGVRHVPITDESGAPIGILSERDLRIAEAIMGGPDEARSVAIALVGSEPVFQIPDTAALGPTLLEMATRRVGSALVTDANGLLIGIVTTTDVCRAFGEDLIARR